MLKQRDYGFLGAVGMIILIAFIDQLSKTWVLSHFHLYESYKLWPGMKFTLALNSGVAFSLFNQGAWWQSWLLTLIAIVVSICLLVNLYHLPKYLMPYQWWGFVAIIGGALGNIVDRLQYQYVVDFIHLYIGAYNWPIFNLADVAICCGVGLWIAELLRKRSDS